VNFYSIVTLQSSVILRYEDADSSPLLVDGGEVPFALKFKLHGSLLAYNLKDDCKIDARIRSVQQRRALFKLSGNNSSPLKGKNVHKT
jgi:hypothetical protein